MAKKKIILYSILFFFYGFSLCLILLKSRGYLAADFQWPIRAGQAILERDNPYTIIKRADIFPLGIPFFNPLPAAIIGIPFTFFDPYIAGSLFFGISSALLGLGILLKGKMWQLYIFFSPAFVISALVAQWSPLLLVGAFIPALQLFMICKPNIGLASFLYNPSKIGIIGTFLFGIFSVLIMPSWPIYWIKNASNETITHFPPILLGYAGLLLGLSLFSWRKPEGRLLLFMTLIPQSPFYYDQLVLYLIPRNQKQMLSYLAITWISFMIWFIPGIGVNRDDVVSSRPYTLFGFYLPVLFIVLLPQINLLLKYITQKLHSSFH